MHKKDSHEPSRTAVIIPPGIKKIMYGLAQPTQSKDDPEYTWIMGRLNLIRIGDSESPPSYLGAIIFDQVEKVANDPYPVEIEYYEADGKGYISFHIRGSAESFDPTPPDYQFKFEGTYDP